MLIAPLKPGDGVVFDAAGWRSPQETEEGGRIFEVRPAGHGKLELLFGNGAVKFGRIRAGDLIWRTSDPEIDRVVRPYLEAATPLHKQPLRIEVHARVGERLRVTCRLMTDAGS